MHHTRFVSLGWGLGLLLAATLAGAQTPAPAEAASAVPAASAPVEPVAQVVVAPPATTAAPAPAPVPAVPVPAPLTRPGLVAADTLNGADTAWMMTSTALVLLMTLPGIALFYGGMVRKKNVLNTMACVVAICAIVSLLWFAVGYSLAFTPGSGALGHYIGGGERLWFAGLDYVKDAQKVAVSHIAPNIPESVYAMFQLTFAIITAALVVGAFVERMRFSAMLCFISLWTLVVYAPIAHWVWEPNGWLAQLGALDFAGGSVVHINAGVAGLVCAYVLGPRRGYGREAFTPFNLGLTMAGAGMLWVGWFGFNAGSAVASDGRAGLAMAVTHIAAAAGALSWMAAEWMVRKRPTLLGLCSGLVAGLVAITPAAGFVSPRAALAIGLIAGVACYWGATGLKRLLNADDSLDVFGVHGVGGIVGSLLTGVFASKTISGVEGSVLTQAIGAGAVLCYSLLMTAVVLWITSLVFSLRVSDSSESDGLDIAQHAERMGT
ncbi:MAG: ammonia channel protein [Polaromonas sp. 39-63-25]|nr:MAG: ammonia channel protein [Polaromonas sp. 35-63-35]OYZ17470.1 MAG: ammonia channel protein [Polaromonas sp. 16-63-31]OYZ76725.1 MAG: ammonia channel protein [Polaromonas sp. 24-63-21]OZA47883.1 MAG: ammonia channel protein [Polaromonas sp. 17-63-33]OZA85999.1 MAG: ammonia channel protein [Polaromonas sp. 39-63-25]